MASTSAAAPAVLRRIAASIRAASPPPVRRSAIRKNWRHDSSTEAGSRRYDSYISAMYPSLKALVMGRDMPENVTRGRDRRFSVRGHDQRKGRAHARFRFHLDPSTEEGGQAARDVESQARASVAAGETGVELSDGFE